VLCFCGFHSASFADTAARLYDQGKYAEAFERYAKAAENAKNNWPLFYNLGAAAYKAGRLDEATQAFERAAGAPDPALQQKALYNLGNSWFRIGEAAEQQMPEQALPVYQRSLKSYESALALDPNDADAEYNRDVVKKKIEELQKQQEQQQQQNQDQKNEDKNKEENEEQQKQDSQNQSQQQQEQPQQQPEEKQTQEQQSQQQEQPGEKEQPPPPQPGQTNHFEQFQARVLLDNLREDERNWNFFPELQMELQEAGEPEKDW
jgi:Ca-activated chloride channel family protein